MKIMLPVTFFLKLTPLFFLVLFSFMGCATYSRIIPESDRLPLLQKNNVIGTFLDQHARVAYRYNFDGRELDISGKVSARGSASTVQVWILFIGKSGKIVGRKILYASGYRSYSTLGRRTFAENYSVPDGTIGVYFDLHIEYRQSPP